MNTGSTHSYCRYYVHDHLFSPVAFAYYTGQIMERYEYDAYGQPTIWNYNLSQTKSCSDYGNNFLFTGREVDILDNGSLKIQYNRNRSYDYSTGRWLQRDPLGVNPSGGKENLFNVLGQYKDGLNLYEAFKSDPIRNTDPKGTASGAACCKIKETHTSRVPWCPGGYAPCQWMELKSTSCYQVTTGKRKTWSAAKACRCLFRKHKNIYVYDAHEGECCWCTISVKKVIGELHWRLVAECEEDKGGKSWAVGFWPNPKSTGVIDCIISLCGKKGCLEESHDYEGITFGGTCRVSCDAAKSFKEMLQPGPYIWPPIGPAPPLPYYTCIQWAFQKKVELCNKCP